MTLQQMILRKLLFLNLYTSVMKTDENGSQYTWTQLKEQYKGTVDSELKTLNDQYHAYLEKNK